MCSLSALWRVLDTESILSAVELQWRMWLGDAFGVVRPFLLPEDNPASSYPCERYPGLCARRVVYYDQTDIVAVCGQEESECDVVPLTPNDVVVYELALTKLLSLFAKPLKLEGTIAPVSGQNVWSMGILKSHGTTLNYFFVLPDRYDRYVTPFARLLSLFPEDDVAILVPNVANIESGQRSMLGQRRIDILSCCNCFEVQHGEIRRTAFPDYLQQIHSAEVIRDSELKYRKSPFAFCITDLASAPTQIGDTTELRKLREKKGTVDHFVDTTGDKPFCCKQKGQKRMSFELTQGETAMLLAFVARAIASDEYERPEKLSIPNLSTDESKRQVFKEMRRKVDRNTTSRQKYALFKARRTFHGGSQLYAFVPDSNTSFCVLVRAADFEDLGVNPLKMHAFSAPT